MENKQNQGGDPTQQETEKAQERPSVSPVARQAVDAQTQTSQPYVDDEAEYVPLPSNGYFYKGQYKGMDKLKVRKLDYTDEDILTTRSYYDNATLFQEILNNTIVDPNGFKAEDLIPVDKDAILYWLRIGAFGREYTIPKWEYTDPQQPNVKKTAPITWDLSDVDRPEYSEKHAEELREHGCITTILPDSDQTVKITCPTMGKELQVLNKMQKRKEKMQTERDFNVTGRILSVLAEVPSENGPVTAMDKVQEWLNKSKLSIRDSRHIQKIAKEISLKLEAKTDFYVKKSGYLEEEVRMQLSIYFFWPEFEDLS